MPNYGYHLARAEGQLVRRLYAAALPQIVRRRVARRAELPYDVFSYSGESMLPEQVASVRSFLRNAGHPRRWTIVSDGSHSPRSRDLLRALDPIIEIAPAGDFLPRNLPSAMHPYLREHPTGKQLALVMSLPADRPALYLDADVLFFRGAGALAFAGDAPAYYLADCGLSADERLLRTPTERERPVNTGVLFLRAPLDWSLGLERFCELRGEPQFFTNQTLTHLVLHANGAQPLDPRTFVLQLDDQFVYPDRYAAPALVLRHYVNPVRHKFWTTLRRSV